MPVSDLARRIVESVLPSDTSEQAKSIVDTLLGSEPVAPPEGALRPPRPVGLSDIAPLTADAIQHPIRTLPLWAAAPFGLAPPALDAANLPFRSAGVLASLFRRPGLSALSALRGGDQSLQNGEPDRFEQALPYLAQLPFLMRLGLTPPVRPPVELLPPVRALPRAMAPIQEAELVGPRRALPAPSEGLAARQPLIVYASGATPHRTGIQYVSESKDVADKFAAGGEFGRKGTVTKSYAVPNLRVFKTRQANAELRASILGKNYLAYVEPDGDFNFDAYEHDMVRINQRLRDAGYNAIQLSEGRAGTSIALLEPNLLQPISLAAERKGAYRAMARATAPIQEGEIMEPRLTLPETSPKLPVTYVGLQDTTGTSMQPFHLVNEPSGTTVEFDPSKHVITSVQKGRAVPPELTTQPVPEAPSILQQRPDLKAMAGESANTPMNPVNQENLTRFIDQNGGYLTHNTDLSKLMHDLGDVSVVVKDVRGSRARMRLSNFIRLTESKPFMDRVREVFVNRESALPVAHAHEFQEGFMSDLRQKPLLEEASAPTSLGRMIDLHGVTIKNNATTSLPQQQKFIAMVMNNKIRSLLNEHGITSLSLEPPYKFSLSEQANFSKSNKTIEMNADADDPIRTILHELGHAKLESLPVHEKAALIEAVQRSHEPSIQGYLKNGAYEEAVAESLYNHPEAIKQRPELKVMASEGPPVPPEVLKGSQELASTSPIDQAERAAIQAESAAPQLVPQLQQLQRARAKAIDAVTRELLDRSRMMGSESARLRQLVREAGGIKPTLGGGLREELSSIRPFLRSKGRAIDDLATELGFESGEDLRQALIASHGVKPPTVAALRQQAIQIVDSEPGGRILEAISAKGATQQTIKGLVREVTAQMRQVARAGGKQIRGVLRAGRQTAMTPAQLARVARVQRVTPGETVVGPRGGTTESPLTPADLAQIQARSAGIVPRRGQPTGAPPRIPTKKSMIPYAEAHYPYHDLTEYQASLASGLEPYRAFHLIDGQRRGPATTGIYEPILAVTRQKADAEKLILERLNRLVPNLRATTLRQRVAQSILPRRGMTEDQALMALGEGKLPPAKITPRTLRAAAEMRETYDALLKQLNAVRVRDGKIPIPARKDYMPHMRAQTLLSEVFGGFDKIPDDAVDVTLGEIHPNSPYAWFQNPRKGGPYQPSAVTTYQAYVSRALEGIYYPDVIRAVRPRIDSLPPRAQGWATGHVDRVLAGRPHPLDLIPPRTLLRWIDQQRARTSQGAVSGNLLSFFNQVLTMPATVSSAGPIHATRALLSLSGNAMSRFVNDLAAKVGWQTAAEAMLKAHQPDALNFIEQHSPLIKYRTYDVDYNVKPTVGGKFNPLAGIATAQNAFDVGMVRWAWWANYLKAARSGVGQAASVRIAEDAATATNGIFEKAALAPIYHSRLAKSFTQFTVSINTVLNYLRFDVGLQPTRLLRAVPTLPEKAPLFARRAMNQIRLAGERLNPNPAQNTAWLRQALYFIGTAVALNELIKASKVPVQKTSVSSLFPGIGALQGQVFATYALPVAVGQRLLAKQPQDISKSDAALVRALALQLPYGNQLRKTIQGLIAVAQGASVTRTGRERFPIRGAAEAGRAILFGPYGTEAGQAYVDAGFKKPKSPFKLSAPSSPTKGQSSAARAQAITDALFR